MIQKLFNYRGLIYDMGLKEDQEGKPAFYILTETGEEIMISITNGEDVAMVRDFMKYDLNTGVYVGFEDFGQWWNQIQKVFKVYGDRIGLVMSFDREDLKNRMTALKGYASEYDVASLAGLGRSTVNDLTRGVTQRPRFFTICKVYSAIHQLEQKKQGNTKHYCSSAVSKRS